MAKTYMNVYLQNLQRQILNTAAKLKNKNVSDQKDFDLAEEFQEFLPRTKVDAKSYSLLDSKSAYVSLNNSAPTSADYAANAYKTSSYDKKTSVAEGIVFKNNRDFNFKV